MRRQTFDAILTAVGAMLAIGLLVAGAMGMWAYAYASSNVHDQLAAQKIYFPAKGSSELASPLIGPYLNKYAGQELTTGAQAKAYADHFIAVHLQEIGGGKTYSQLSAESQANPNNAKLASEVDTIFRGTTLRGLLLEAYAFGTIGQVAFWAGVASFIMAGIMLVLTVLGFLHLRRVSPTAQL